MRIAVSYVEENGDVFDHFGHAPAFKVYDVENGEVTAAEVIHPEGMGHHVMVGLMRELNVQTVICGRIGGHALDGLKEASVEVFFTDPGKADDAVQAYLKGELKTPEEGAECGCGGHDHEESCGCGSDEAEGGCGGGCGGCAGCGEPTIIHEGKNAGKQCAVHYRGTLDDGSVFDSSYDRNEPLAFICGIGQMIAGFDKAVVNMEVGEEIDIHLEPEEAYGPKDPARVITAQISQLPGSEDLSVGDQVYLTGAYGQPVPVEVTAKDDTNITLDANHPMAGKSLNFHIQLVSVEE